MQSSICVFVLFVLLHIQLSSAIIVTGGTIGNISIAILSNPTATVFDLTAGTWTGCNSSGILYCIGSIICRIGYSCGSRDHIETAVGNCAI